MLINRLTATLATVFAITASTADAQFQPRAVYSTPGHAVGYYQGSVGYFSAGWNGAIRGRPSFGVPTYRATINPSYAGGARNVIQPGRYPAITYGQPMQTGVPASPYYGGGAAAGGNSPPTNLYHQLASPFYGGGQPVNIGVRRPVSPPPRIRNTAPIVAPNPRENQGGVGSPFYP